MKKLIQILFVGIALVAIVACSSDKGSKSKIKKDRSDRSVRDNEDDRLTDDRRDRDYRKDRGDDPDEETLDDLEIEIGKVEINIEEMITNGDGSMDGGVDNTTGAALEIDGRRRMFLDLENDGMLSHLRQKMTSEGDSNFQALSLELAGRIRRTYIQVKRDSDQNPLFMTVRIGFVTGQGPNKLTWARFVSSDIDGSGRAKLVETDKSTKDYEFQGEIQCMDPHCENAGIRVEQLRDLDGDGDVEPCKRIYVIHRSGNYRVKLDESSHARIANGSSKSQAYNEFGKYLNETIRINKSITETGEWPETINGPFSAYLILRSWTVPYGASEFITHLEKALNQKDIDNGAITDVTKRNILGFRGFLFSDNRGVSEGGGDALEYGHPWIIENGRMVKNGYAAGITNAFMSYNDDNGRIDLLLYLQGEPNLPMRLELESLITQISLSNNSYYPPK